MAGQIKEAPHVIDQFLRDLLFKNYLLKGRFLPVSGIIKDRFAKVCRASNSEPSSTRRGEMNNKRIRNMLQQMERNRSNLKVNKINKFVGTQGGGRFVNDQVKQISSKYAISFNNLIKHQVKTWEEKYDDCNTSKNYPVVEMKLLQEGNKKRGGGGREVVNIQVTTTRILALKNISNDALSHSYPHKAKK